MKTAYIVAHKNFRDEEYFIPKEILEGVGITVDTFSDESGEARGTEGGVASVEILNNINPNDYEAIIIAGGEGAIKYLNNDEVKSLLNEFYQRGKLVAAICISPIILAEAGLLKDKKATVWSSGMNKSAVKKLKNKGVNYIDKQVVADGRIITANGPEAAKEFGRRIAINLKS